MLCVQRALLGYSYAPFFFQVMDASKCFEKQVPSALSLQLAAYYYSLQIYVRLVPCFQDQCHPLYRVSPLGCVTPARLAVLLPVGPLGRCLHASHVP